MVGVNPDESSSNIITINSDNRTQNANIELVSSNQVNQSTSSNIGVKSGGIIKAGSNGITTSGKGTGISMVSLLLEKEQESAQFVLFRINSLIVQEQRYGFNVFTSNSL